MWLQCASRTVLGLVIGTVLLLTVSGSRGFGDEWYCADSYGHGGGGKRKRGVELMGVGDGGVGIRGRERVAESW